ncbi:MAG: hypothetical protein HGA85_02115 [Nanoarchaeota archaeon]|nr:hypothetical protein [Nanoarchaeota archaeon]
MKFQFAPLNVLTVVSLMALFELMRLTFKGISFISLLPFFVIFIAVSVISMFRARVTVNAEHTKKTRFKFAALSGIYMASSILGIMISLIYVYKNYPDWGVAFTALFSIMFVASMVSMTYADADEYVAMETKGRKAKASK